jgi:hypothetical protein
MIKQTNFETYLYISKNTFNIFVYEKINRKNLYNEKLEVDEQFNFQDLNNLSKFLDDNIFKIEKLIGIFINNIILIIESDEISFVDVGIKKKRYDSLVGNKNLEKTLVELKDLFKESYKDRHIMHMVIVNYFINGKKYSTFVNDLDVNELCLEVSFRSISNNLVSILDKILEKYQIKVNQYMDGKYISSFFDENFKLPDMADKIRNGYNENEIIIVPKNVRNIGFFEKFFQFFS